MTYIHTGKTILFASLIAAMILPFSGMDYAKAQTPESDFIKEIKKQDIVKGMSDSKREQFIQKVEDKMKATPYDKKVFKLLEKLSNIKEKIIRAEDKGKDTTKLIQKAWAIIYDLEDYGVVTEDRLLQNKDYWHDKAQDARDQIAKGETVGASFENSETSNIKRVHTTNVSLKNQSQIDYQCSSWWGWPIYCPSWDIEWGGGSQSHAQQTMLFSSTVYMEGKICLDDKDDHSGVNFTFDSEFDAYSSTGSHVFDKEYGPSSKSLSSEGYCWYFNDYYSGISAVAGTTAHSKTNLATTVTTTG